MKNSIMTEENKTKKNPFSPLQTGCAFVMLTNMLIYLCVVAFIFNLLDPSKLDPNYLVKRGFTTQKTESPQDQAFRKLVEEKKEEQRQVQSESMDLSVSSLELEPSSADQLSKISVRQPIRNWQYLENKPTAKLTHNFTTSFYETSTQAKSRQNLMSSFPRAKLSKAYELHTPRTPKTIAPELYDVIAIELVPGVSIPLITIAVQNDTQTNSTPRASSTSSHSTPKLIAPSTQSKPLQTNGIKIDQTIERIEPPKDTL